MRLQQRVALITGANNPLGIGAEVARVLAGEGAQVALSFLRLGAPATGGEFAPGDELYAVQRAKDAGEVVDAIRARGGIAAARETDLTRPDTIAALFDWAERTLGPVDVLVNCAAHYEPEGDSIAAITPAALARTFALNVSAAVLLMREFVERLKQRGARDGRIVNFSTDGARCFPGQIAYAASKAALESLTRSIAREVVSLGITVNAIAPGPVQTGSLTGARAQAIGAELLGARVGTPRDVAEAVLFFVSPAAAWTTGQILTVAGGHEL